MPAHEARVAQCALCYRAQDRLTCSECANKVTDSGRAAAATHRTSGDAADLLSALRPLMVRDLERAAEAKRRAELLHLKRTLEHLKAKRDAMERRNAAAALELESLVSHQEALKKRAQQRRAGRSKRADAGSDDSARRWSREVAQARRKRLRDIMQILPIRSIQGTRRGLAVGLPAGGVWMPASTTLDTLERTPEKTLSTAAGSVAFTVRALAEALDHPLPYALDWGGSRSYLVATGAREVGETIPARQVHAGQALQRSSSQVMAGLSLLAGGVAVGFASASAAIGSASASLAGWAGFGAGESQTQVRWLGGNTHTIRLPLWIDSHSDPQQRASFLLACSRLNCNIASLLHSQRVRVARHDSPTALGGGFVEGAVTLCTVDCLVAALRMRRSQLGVVERPRPLRGGCASLHGVCERVSGVRTVVDLEVRVSADGEVSGTIAAGQGCRRDVEGSDESGTLTVRSTQEHKATCQPRCDLCSAVSVSLTLQRRGDRQWAGNYVHRREDECGWSKEVTLKERPPGSDVLYDTVSPVCVGDRKRREQKEKRAKKEAERREVEIREAGEAAAKEGGGREGEPEAAPHPDSDADDWEVV